MEYKELKRVRTLVNCTKRFPDRIFKKKRQNEVMSCIIQRMLRKGRYRISIVLAFSCGWAKTIGIRVFFSKKEEKMSGLKNIGIRVEMALMKTTIFFCNFIFVSEFTRNVQYIQLIWLT